LSYVSRLVANETSQLFPTNPDGTRSVDRSWDQRDTWKQMEDVYRSGKVKAIGVSNFSIPYLESLEKTWEVVPAVNQVRSPPSLMLKEFIVLILGHRLNCILTARNMR
jgi:glycerol 2-dehydrogenase (NADP+)